VKRADIKVGDVLALIREGRWVGGRPPTQVTVVETDPDKCRRRSYGPPDKTVVLVRYTSTENVFRSPLRFLHPDFEAKLAEYEAAEKAKDEWRTKAHLEQTARQERLEALLARAKALGVKATADGHWRHAQRVVVDLDVFERLLNSMTSALAEEVTP
jgi:hypothetical protein